MTRRRAGGSLLLVLALAIGGGPVRAQEEELLPAIVPGMAAGETGMTSLGRTPGAGGPLIENAPRAGEPLLGGRPGLSPDPRDDHDARGGYAAPPTRALGAPPSLPISTFPLYGPLEVPTGPEEEGPRAGLTLDQAIERLVAANLDLRARSHEIPKVQADILTAGLRANPLVFFDAQQVA